MAEVKICTSCGDPKAASEFYRRREGRLRAQCKACWRVKSSVWVAKNPERNAYLHKMKSIERKTGLTRYEYAAKLLAQDFRCIVCAKPFKGTRGSRSPCVDHNHETKKVRDILCLGCNAALGSACEDPRVLRELADYAEKWSTDALA